MCPWFRPFLVASALHTVCTMRAILKKSVLAGALTLGVLMPSAASAVTLDEIVSLSRAGVTDAIILALIDRDKTVFAIEPDQIVKLQRDGAERGGDPRDAEERPRRGRSGRAR